MNVLLGTFSFLLTFSLMTFVERFFKKEGLYVWICVATVASNVLVLKSVDLFGLTTNLGNIMFISVFSASDIMNEKYGSGHSKKAAVLGVVSQIVFSLACFFSLLYAPSSVDLNHVSMKNLFSMNLRVSFSSVAMYIAGSFLDIYLFCRIKQKYPNFLWLRNNISTIISSCLQNYIFAFLAFFGTYDLVTLLSIASVACVLEAIISLAATPFVYLTKNSPPKLIKNPPKTSSLGRLLNFL